MTGFGSVIYNLRHEQGMSQPRFAELISDITGAEVTRSAISMWERGLRVPKIDVIIKIANYFAMDVDDLLDVAKTSLLYANTDEEPMPREITMIGRASKKMTPEQRKQMLAVLRAMFPEEFDG